MITIPELIDMCLWFAADEMTEHQETAVLYIVLGNMKEHTIKYAKRVTTCFRAADMIYEGEYR